MADAVIPAEAGGQTQEVGAAARIPGAIFSPGATFASIARRPTWVLPLLLWTVISFVVTSLIIPKIDWEHVTRQALEKRNQKVSEDAMPGIVERSRKIGSTISWFFGFAGPALASLFVALVIWGAFKAFGWDTTFRQSFGVTTHAFIPGVLGSVLLIPIVLKRETIDPEGIRDLLRSNLGFLVERDTAKVAHSVLQSVDLFSIWTIVLLIIGFAAAAKIPKKSAAGVIIGLWVLLVLLRAGWAAIF
jgi:hypothetical protein